MSYVIHVLIQLGLYAILSVSLGLVVGYGGLLSLCHAAFYGIGAYATTLLTMRLGYSFPLALALGVTLTALVGYAFATVSLRLNGDFFLLATIAFQVITFTILYNLDGVTGGPYGVSGIAAPTFSGFTVSSQGAFLILTLVIAAVSVTLMARVAHSPFGRTLRAVRDDAVAAASLGKNPTQFRRWAFTVSAAFAAVAGALYASYSTYIDPTSFTIDESILTVCAVVIGGTGTIRGALIGAAFITLLPEALRFTAMPDAIAANLREAAYGLLLVIMMRVRPHGAAGRYAFN